MLCTNSFSSIDLLSDLSPPNEPSPRVRLGITPGPTRTPAKRSPGHMQRPLSCQARVTGTFGPTEARGRNAGGHQQNQQPQRPTNLPSRLRNQATRTPPGLCGPASGGPRTLLGPCLTVTPPRSEERSNVQPKQPDGAPQPPPGPTTTGTHIPVPTSQSLDTPIPSKKDAPRPQSGPTSRSNQDTRRRNNTANCMDVAKSNAQEMLSSTPTQRERDCVKPQPHTPEGVSRSTTDANPLFDLSSQPNEGLPPPPGLSKPNGRGKRPQCGRGHAETKAADGERHANPAVGDASVKRDNGIATTNHVVSPLPARVTPRAVNPSPNKDAQHSPRTPTTVASFSSEDMSDSSFVLSCSQTTITSVDTDASNNVSPYHHHKTSRHICKNWSKGYNCFKTPCPYLHERHQYNNPASHSTLLPTTLPRPSHPAETIIGKRDQKNDSPSRRRELPSTNAELSSKPEPLYTTTISDHIKVRFDQGFEVREVMTGFESRWVHLGNVPSTVTAARLNELLAPYNVENVHLPGSSGKSMTVKVQFSSSADAIKAVTDLNGTEFAKRTINAKLAINNSKCGGTVLTDTDVQLAWPCPTRNGFAGYDTKEEAKAVIDAVHGSTLENSVVSAQLYTGLPCVGMHNVIFAHLPAKMTEQSLRQLAKSEAVMYERPNYTELDRAIKYFRSRLEEYGTVVSFDVLPPPYRDGMVKAWAHFTSPAEARAAQEDLDRRRPGVIGHTTVSCRHIISLSHVLSAASHRKMYEDIRWLRSSWQHRYGPAVSIRERVKDTINDDNPVYIKLSTERPELLSHLKYEFEQLLHGDTVTLEKKPVWDDFLITQAGHSYIAQVHAQYPRVEIQVQNNRRVVSLWGPAVPRHRARGDIIRKVMELKAQKFWKIPLSGKVVGTFCSPKLSTLQQMLGLENCTLNLAERTLVVRGNDAAFQMACKIVQDIQDQQGDRTVSSDAICPVCFGEVVVPVSLPCSHKWCRTCLTGYLTSAVDNKTFPLRCLGNDALCTQCIPLGLSRTLLSAADFQALTEVAFWAYVHARPDEFFNCPTPDCTQVYRSAPPNAVLQCPSCLVRICPACRIEYHDGMTCQERDVVEDELFKAWSDGHDVKGCPGCRAPIERSEGCNHMTCTQCQTHICWECLATFPKGQGIYEHMRLTHGGIGL